MSYPLGQPVRLTFATFSDVDETVPADPTALTLTATLPDATTTVLHWPSPAEISRDSTGVFHYDYTGPTDGTYLVEWEASGAVASTATGQFDVVSQRRYIVSLEDARVHLNDPTMTADGEDKLRGFIAAATVVIEDDPVHGIGPVAPREVVVDFPNPGTTLILPLPIASITSVTAYTGGVGVVYTETDLTVAPGSYEYRASLTAGLLYLAAGSWGGSTVRVVLQAGRTVMPANVRLAALELIRFWWQPSQLGQVSDAGPLRGGGGTGATVLASGYLVPNAVLQLLAPYRRTASVA